MVTLEDDQVECLKTVRGAWAELKLEEKKELPVTVAKKGQPSWDKLQAAMDKLAGWDLSPDSE